MPGYSTGFGASPVQINVGAVKVEPKHKNRWKVTFAGGALDANTTANATDITRPSVVFDEIEVHRGESKAYFAGKPTFDPVTIDFDDSLDNATADAIYAQVATQFDTSSLAVAKDGSVYKFTTVLELTDGTGTVLETITLYGSWVSKMTPDQLSYSESAGAKISMDIRYDLPVRS